MSKACFGEALLLLHGASSLRGARRSAASVLCLVAALKGYGQARSSSGFTCLDMALYRYIFGPPNPDRLEYPKTQYPSDVKPEALNPESYILHP